MPVDFQNNQSGGTPGTAVTVANSGGASGVAYTHVVKGTGSTIDYVTVDGRTVIEIVYGTGAAYVRYDDTTVTDEPRRVAGARFRFPVAPNGGSALLITMRASGGTFLGGVELTNTMRLRAVKNGFLPVNESISPSSDPLVTNRWYRVENSTKSAPDANNGLVHYTFVDEVTGLEVFTWTPDGTVTTATVAPSSVRWGDNTSANIARMQISDTKSASRAGGWLGPLVNFPIVNAGADLTNVEPLSTVTLSATANMAVTTWTWAQTGGPAVTLTGTGASRTFKAPANENGATLTFTVSADGSPTDTVVVEVLPHDLWVLRGGELVPAQMLTINDF